MSSEKMIVCSWNTFRMGCDLVGRSKWVFKWHRLLCDLTLLIIRLLGIGRIDNGSVHVVCLAVAVKMLIARICSRFCWGIFRFRQILISIGYWQIRNAFRVLSATHARAGASRWSRWARRWICICFAAIRRPFAWWKLGNRRFFTSLLGFILSFAIIIIIFRFRRLWLFRVLGISIRHVVRGWRDLSNFAIRMPGAICANDTRFTGSGANVLVVWAKPAFVQSFIRGRRSSVRGTIVELIDVRLGIWAVRGRCIFAPCLLATAAIIARFRRSVISMMKCRVAKTAVKTRPLILRPTGVLRVE